MKIAADKTRNFVVAGHAGSGKTSLCDLMLFKGKAVERFGKVDQNTSISDYTQDEQEKKSSIYATTLHCDWHENHFFFNDTPGYGEFICETIAALTASDAALIVIDGVSGIEVGTSRAMNIAVLGAYARAIEAKETPFTKEILLEAMKGRVPSRWLEANLKAFELGYSVADKQIKEL